MPTVTDISQLDLTDNFTYADYYGWQFDDRVELIRGKLHAMERAPLRVHQGLISCFLGNIGTHFFGKPETIYAMPFDVRLTTGGANGDAQITTVVQPDVCVVYDPQKLALLQDHR